MSLFLVILLTITGILPALFVIFIILSVISSLFVRNKNYTKNSKYFRFLLHFGTFLTLFTGRVKVEVKGKEKLPNKRFLLVQNHRSCYDPIITWQALKDSDMAFISKESNIKILIFGKVVRKCCFMPIDREDPRKAVTTINEAAELIKNDVVSIGVYPEGTRSKTLELLPFHNAVFKIAIKAGVPIVVTTVKKTETIHKRYFIKETVVQLEISDVLDEKFVSENGTKEIGGKVLEVMEESLGE